MRRRLGLFCAILILVITGTINAAQELKQSTQIKVRLGSFVDVGDGFTPQTDITLAGEEAELLKHNGAGTVDISGATFSAVTACDGWYDLTLTAAHTDTLGLLTIVAQDLSDHLPVFVDFMVVTANYWDSKYSTDKLQVHVVEMTDSVVTAAVIATDAIGASEIAAGAIGVSEFAAEADNIGINWADVSNPTTTVTLSGTTIATCSIVTNGLTTSNVNVASGIVEANIEQIENDNQSSVDLKDFADAGYDPGNDRIVKVYQLTELDEDNTTIDLDGITIGTSSTVSTLTGHTVQTGDSFAIVNNGTYGNSAIENLVDDIGVAGAGLSAVPWNSSWDAEVLAQATASIVEYNLDHWMKVVTSNSATLPEIVDDTVLANILTKTDGDTSDFDFTSDSLEAIKDALLTSSDNIGINWADVSNPTTSLGLSGTTIATASNVTAVATDVTTILADTAAQDTSSELRTLLAGSDTTLSTVTTAQVNAQVLDVIYTDIFAEMSQGAPPASPTVVEMLNYIYRAYRNKTEVTSGSTVVYDDAGSTVLFKTVLSDDGTTFSKGEYITGP